MKLLMRKDSANDILQPLLVIFFIVFVALGVVFLVGTYPLAAGVVLLLAFLWLVLSAFFGKG